MTNLTQRKQPQRNDPSPKVDHDKEIILREAPPFFTKLLYASYMYGLKSILNPVLWVRDWQESRDPPPGWPDIIKNYECRPHLPVRIFLPRAYKKTSQVTLPTLFTVHGGGFCIGHQRDDDEWNRAFANTQSVLVISLNYSKAPGSPFPTGLHDLEALLLAALADTSLPIDRTTDNPTTRTAILGFSAGANLALSVSQLPSIRTHRLTPAAALSIYGCLDVSYPPHEKLSNRPWKTTLPAPRNSPRDGLISLAPAFDWSYIPYGQALRDPLLSPGHAARGDLPGYICVVGAELDMLAHESWRFACRLSREGGGAGRGRRVVPDRGSADARWRVCGNSYGAVTTGRGELVGLRVGAGGVGKGEEEERYAFEESWEGGGVKWLLVPDVLHGFDNVHIRGLVGGKEAMRDAELKTAACMAELGRWLRDVVWKV